jgi:hypothetical protein
MKSAHADLLLLNVSNYRKNPIYPYAFIQVTAIARRNGLSVATFDFLSTPRQEWYLTIGDLLETHKPRIVGFHIRQADNQTLKDYDAKNSDCYQPVADTRTVIEFVRAQSDVPIVIGGFAVSVHGAAICEYLQPDYAVIGDPNGFFESFSAFASRANTECDNVPNVASIRTGFVPKLQRFYPLASMPEYDEELFREVVSFYDTHSRTVSVGKLGEADFPVEIMRGCPCNCYFCTEPGVKGRRERQRDLDIVMEDVRFLAERNVRCVWFICSELNMYGMTYPLQIADRMKEFNSTRGTNKMLWKAYAMPRPGMSKDQIRYLMSTGYVPGWNEFISFDDENLRACGMPYRAADAVRYFNDIIELSQEPSLYSGPPLLKFEMFLGNAHMTPKALSTTLEVVDREGYSQIHQFGDAATATRVYTRDGKLICGTMASVVTFGPDRSSAKGPIFPTFYQPNWLLEALGSRDAISDFFGFVSSTLLSRNYQFAIDIPGFLSENATPDQLAAHVKESGVPGMLTALHVIDLWKRSGASIESSEDNSMIYSLFDGIWQNPNANGFSDLLNATTISYTVRARVLVTVLDVVFALNQDSFTYVLNVLSLSNPEDRKSPYRVMRKLYQLFSRTDDIVPFACDTLKLDPYCIDILQLRCFLLMNNVLIRPDYGNLLFASVKPII